ncbi:MAG: sulfotransferase, partial [Actinomycetia bacterium]|nr:sulfotransferase [Actinomycetes bacterium]
MKEQANRRAGRHREPKSLLLIFGSQRSGTTMLSSIFDADPQARLFDEMGSLSSSDPNRLRLNDLDDVRSQMQGSLSPLVVAKPLVESHRVVELLEELPNSYAVWMFRSYIDVTSSRLKRWGDDVGDRNLRPIYENDQTSWRAVDLEPHVRDMIVSHPFEDLSAADGSALFWYARNTHFFRQHLHEHPRVLMVRYEDLVTDPRTTMGRVYRLVGRPPADGDTYAHVVSSSVGKGSHLEIAADIRAVCDEMTTRLEQAYADQMMVDSDDG